MSIEENQELTEEQQLAQAMALLEQTPETEEVIEELEDSIASNTSQTLQELEKDRQPKMKIACQACPNSMWFSSPEEVKCYCRIMHTISWGGNDSSLITKCDGLFLD